MASNLQKILIAAGIFFVIVFLTVFLKYKDEFTQFDPFYQSVERQKNNQVYNSGEYALAMEWIRLNANGKKFINWWDSGSSIERNGAMPLIKNPAKSMIRGVRECADNPAACKRDDFVWEDENAFSKSAQFLAGDYSNAREIANEVGGEYIFISDNDNANWQSIAYSYCIYKSGNPNTALGSSTCETEIYPEYLYVMLEKKSDGSFTRSACKDHPDQEMYYSSFGAIYCLDKKGQLSFFDQNGQIKKMSDPKLIYGGESTIKPTELQGSVYINGNYTFKNLNPDLSTLTFGKLKNKYFKTTFVQLYYYEKIDGFSLVFKSDDGKVKIFKID